jgi:aspartate 1-decarboxylase
VGGISCALLDAAGLPYEQVQVVNVNNGVKIDDLTYAIAVPPNSGKIELNGAAARLGVSGDRAIVMTYTQLIGAELETFCPTVVLVSDRNQLQEVRRYDDLLLAQA